MSSIRISGARFVVYTNDHLPRHIHVFIGDAEVIVDLLESGDVDIAGRADAIRPRNAKATDVKRALRLCSSNFERLEQLWRNVHG